MGVARAAGPESRCVREFTDRAGGICHAADQAPVVLLVSAPRPGAAEWAVPMLRADCLIKARSNSGDKLVRIVLDCDSTRILGEVGKQIVSFHSQISALVT